MKDRLTPSEVEKARKNRIEGMRLQEIENNPLSPEQIEMFEMFEHEGWSHEKRRAHILARIKSQAADATE